MRLDGDEGVLLHKESGPHLCVTGLAIHADSRRAAVATGFLQWPHGDVAPPPAGLRLFDLGTRKLLPPLASSPHKDPRAPQNLVPIGGLERELRRRLGDQQLLFRSLAAAARTAA